MFAQTVINGKPWRAHHRKEGEGVQRERSKFRKAFRNWQSSPLCGKVVAKSENIIP